MSFLHRLRGFIDRRLQPAYLTFAAGTIVGVTLVLAVVLFATSDRGKTALGIPLGADFAGFYVAAQMLNQGESSRLYDRARHSELYHELLPYESEREQIPYVHPPFVAGLLRPLARLPYPTAVAIWLVISGTVYLASMLLMLKTLPWADRQQWGLILLLACSFEPFAFECWLGGQLSAIGFGSYALCWAALQRSRPVWAGLALGICFYKPTLLIVVLPLLVVGRQWRMLLGMTMTGLALAIVSVALVGWDVNIGYLGELLSFNKSTSGGDLELRTWKYVDLNNCLRLWLGQGSSLQLPLLAASGLIAGLLLIREWWGGDRLDSDAGRMLWAATVTWTPVLNLYVGIYDSILIVQSILITATLLNVRAESSAALTRSGFAYLVSLIFVAPWFSQNLAARTGVPLYTLLLVSLGVYQLWVLRSLRSHAPADQGMATAEQGLAAETTAGD